MSSRLSRRQTTRAKHRRPRMARRMARAAVVAAVAAAVAAPATAYGAAPRVTAGAYAVCLHDARALSVSADVCELLASRPSIARWDRLNRRDGWHNGRTWRLDGVRGAVGGRHCWVWLDDTSVIVCPSGAVGAS